MDNTAPQRKRPGRSTAKLTPEKEQPTDASNPLAEEEIEPAGISNPLIDNSNASCSPTPLDISGGASAASGAECRRSSRKKIIKFDVRDLLNKNRKPHKIQIEARIDSNAPTPPPSLQSAPSGSSTKQAVGPTVAIASTSRTTTPTELTNKQKTFIEKSAIFRRYSISAEQQNKLTTAMRSPFPLAPGGAVKNSEGHEIPIDTAKIAQARRLSRTQEIFNASMMKSKQNSSLIIAQMESNSSSSSSTFAMQRRMTVNASAVSDASKRRGARAGGVGRGAMRAYEPSIASERSSTSSSTARSRQLQKKRGRPPKSKNEDISPANISSATRGTISTKRAIQLTPDKAKNWREYKACFNVNEQPSPTTTTSKTLSQSVDEVLEISSTSDSETDSVQSPGSDESFILNEPTTGKRRSKQRNFAAVSFMKEISSKFSKSQGDVAAPEFVVASVDEIHSEPLTPCSSLPNLHDSQLLAVEQRRIAVDVPTAAELQPTEASVIEVKEPREPVESSANTEESAKMAEDDKTLKEVVAKVTQEKSHESKAAPITRKSSSSSSESETNSERSHSKPYKRGDKLRVSLKRLSPHKLASSITSISSPSSPSSSSESSSSSIKEESSNDRSLQPKNLHRKRSKRLLQQELEKIQISDTSSSSFEEHETTIATSKKRKIKRTHIEKDVEKKETAIEKAEERSSSQTTKEIAIEEKPQTSKQALHGEIRKAGEEKKGIEIVNMQMQGTVQLGTQEKEGENKSVSEKSREEKEKTLSRDEKEKIENQNEKMLSSSQEAIKIVKDNADKNFEVKTTKDLTEQESIEKETKDNLNAGKNQLNQTLQNKASSMGTKEHKEIQGFNVRKIENSDTESQDEIEKLNREIENEIAKEIKDLINKDIEKDTKKETDEAIKTPNIQQLNAKKCDDLQTASVVPTTEEQNDSQTDVKKGGKTEKVAEEEIESKISSSMEQKVSQKVSGICELLVSKQKDTKQRTPTPPGKQSRSKQQQECLTPESKIDENEPVKRRLRSATPPENKPKESSITASTAALDNLPEHEKNPKELPKVTQDCIPPAAPTEISGEGESVKLSPQTAVETPSSSSSTASSKTMPKSRETIKLPPKKLLREHHLIETQLHDEPVNTTNTQILPTGTILIPQVTDLVNVETKTLLDILKTVKSNEAACGTAECIEKTEEELNTKVLESPNSPKSPKSPKSPVGRSTKKPTTTVVRRYERRSKRGGEDETLHKTLEETFAAIAAQSSKAILEMYSNREAADSSESQNESKAALKVKPRKESPVNIKESTVDKNEEEFGKITTEVSSQKIPEDKTDKDIEQRTEERTLKEKMTEKPAQEVKRADKGATVEIKETQEETQEKLAIQDVEKLVSKDATQEKIIVKEFNDDSNNSGEKQKPEDKKTTEQPEKEIAVAGKSSDADFVEKMPDNLKKIEESTQCEEKLIEDINSTATKTKDQINTQEKSKLIENLTEKQLKLTEKLEAKDKTKMAEEVIIEKPENRMDQVDEQRKLEAETSDKIEKKTIEESVKALMEDRSEKTIKPINEEKVKPLEEKPLEEKPLEEKPLEKNLLNTNKTEHKTTTDVIVTSNLKAILVETTNPEVTTKEESLTKSLEGSKLKKDVELAKEIKEIETTKSENKKLEGITEANTSTLAKRGRKPKTKARDSSSLQTDHTKTEENLCASHEMEKKLEHISNISERRSSLNDSTENKELPYTESTEVRLVGLDTTEKAENVAEIKEVINDPVVPPQQNLEVNLNIVSISKKTEECSGQKLNLIPETAPNPVYDGVGKPDIGSSRKSSIVPEKSIETMPSSSADDQPKIIEKSSIRKTEETNPPIKASPGLSKKSDKSKEKPKSATSASIPDKTMLKSAISSDENILPKPPPKKRYLKAQLEQAADYKDPPVTSQEKNLSNEFNSKKNKKSIAKPTTPTKERLASDSVSEKASLPTPSKQSSKTKQKRSVTPADQISNPTQTSSKKKAKKNSEEIEQAIVPAPKIPDKRDTKKLDTKKFLESEQDADSRIEVIEDKTVKKNRQRKLKEAFEAALKGAGKNKAKDNATPSVTISSSIVTAGPMGVLLTGSAITQTISTEHTNISSVSASVETTSISIGTSSTYTQAPTETDNTSALIKRANAGESNTDSVYKSKFETTPNFDIEISRKSPYYNMPLTPTNFDLKTTSLREESKPVESTPPLKEVAVQPQEDPDDPLKDIEKFIEDGVNLLKRGYKIENDEDDSVDGVVLNAAKKLVKEDLLSTPVKNKALESQTDLAAITSFADTPADTPLATPSATPPPKSPSGPETPPPLSDDSFTTSGGVRRSHRIKQNSKMPKALVGRGLVRDKERVSLKDDIETKTHYTIDDHRMDLAEVEAKNAKFLKDMEERLSNFRVIKENEYKCERIVSKEAKKMICDCFLTAEEEERGELGCGEDCLNRLLMIECGPDCNVKERCTNKRFQKFLCSPCRVFRTEKKGFGIMADIEILPGEFIMEYVGEVINGDEFERRRIVYSLDKNRHYYFMALRSDAIIDATSKGNISRFINHSCDPNAETQKWTVNGELRIGFFSRKSIMPGEEITFDYQYQRYGREAQRCYCESSNCRGWIGEEPNSDEGEQIDDDSDGDEEEENLAESLLADDDDSDETDADADAEEAQKKLEKAAAEAKLTPIIAEDEQKKQLLGTAASGEDKRKKSDADAEGGILDSSKEEDSKSKFKKLLSKMAEKVAKKKDKKERRRKQRTQRDEAAIKPIKPRFLEDPDIEDEVQFLSRCGLKNQSDTLRLSRLMVRAKLAQTRLNLLKILRSGELPCRRLFLDYHGLRLLHGWMSEDGGDLNIRLALLETLESLPIVNKTVLKDSKVYHAVRNWCDNGAPGSGGESSRSQSVSPSDDSSKESTTSGAQVTTQPQEIPSELRKLASKLTATWDSLPEIFRIPKRERIEQMKEHEREADRQYAAVAATRGEEDKRRSYSSYDRYQRDRFGRSGPYGGGGGGGGGTNNSHRYAWSRGVNGGGNGGKDSRNSTALGGNGSNGDPRRRIVGGGGSDTASHGSTDATKHLSKEQRREMFAAKVARDEAEKRLAEERREFETKCRFFGLDPKKTRPQNLPFCVNPSTGQWYSADRKPIPTPPSYAHVQVPVKPKSTNPGDYQLPATIANLSHKWKFAISPQGKIYYYHVQYRIPQWEPPTLEQMYGDSANTQAGGASATSNSDSGSDGLTNESTDDDDELIKGMEPARLQAYVDQKIEMRRQQRYSRLVDERSISPRREEDRIYNQIEVRKYKENKEKIRKRKEEIRRRRIEAVHNSTLNMCTLGRLDEVLSNTANAIKSAKAEDNDSVLPIQDYLLSSDEEETIKAECNNSPLIDKIVQGDKIVDELDALTSKRPLKRPLPTHRDFSSSSSSRGLSGSSTSSSPGTYSSSSSSVDKHEQHKKRKLEKRELSKSKKSREQDSKYRKLKEKFRCEIAGIIVHHLKPYRKDACIIGRIQSDEDFNHLARKLTHFVMIKELKYCESVGQTLVVTESVKNKSREFIKKYMAKYGDVYVKPENDPDFKDIPFTLKI